MKGHDRSADRVHVVIVGGGFAGLTAAKALADEAPLSVTLIDQRNHHLFQPLLYQVATAGLNPSNIAVPIRAQFTKNDNIAVHLGEVTDIDLAESTLRYAPAKRPPPSHLRPTNEASPDDALQLSFDYLILAPGAQHSYFGNSEWEEHAPGLKTLEQATEIRRRILGAFERAENELDEEKQRSLLTFVVVGGGPTGVELAGAIAEIARKVLVKDFRRIDPGQARVLLVEAGPRILPAFAEPLSLRVVRDLEDLGVEVRTSCRVEDIQPGRVHLGDETLLAENAFWAAGVQAAHLGKLLGIELDRAGRVKVAPDLSLPNHPNVFAVGDFAHVPLKDGGLLPGVAPAAIQTGKTAAENVLASVRGKPRKTFVYKDKGQMATVGKSKAIVEIGKLHLAGRLAWIAWLLVHVRALIGFRNRATVFFEWVWNYVFHKRGARLITSRTWRSERAHEAQEPVAHEPDAREAQEG